jgi:tetratricopeptide (TPR) repeat protein
LRLDEDKNDAGYLKSMMLYRAGRLAQALDCAEHTHTERAPDDESGWLALALINAQAGHVAAAREYLDEAQRIWTQKLAKPEDERPDPGDRAGYRLMRHEAETILSGKSG